MSMKQSKFTHIHNTIMFIVHIMYFQENLKNFIHVLVNNVKNNTLTRKWEHKWENVPVGRPASQDGQDPICLWTGRRLLEPLQIPREGRVIIERLH